ncbi:MULE domain-containing protein [Aphis craccivora]|uniref:MULE domain-containing protein n=1 Tax=Aphis craccivora TaxID=307492 RepID=A0A6G0Z7K8_APHCR|nr:MULE domain-containing protein [Aphis craccivora]
MFNQLNGMLDGLIFLHINNVTKGLEFLTHFMRDEATDLMEYFTPIYTNDCPKILDKNKRIDVKNISALFSPFI